MQSTNKTKEIFDILTSSFLKLEISKSIILLDKLLNNKLNTEKFIFRIELNIEEISVFYLGIEISLSNSEIIKKAESNKLVDVLKVIDFPDPFKKVMKFNHFNNLTIILKKYILQEKECINQLTSFRN